MLKATAGTLSPVLKSTKWVNNCMACGAAIFCKALQKPVCVAVQAHGTMNIGLPQGPNVFLFSDPVESTKRLVAAGFESVSVTTKPQIWSFSSSEEVFEALLHGSVRGAATQKGQDAEALKKIWAIISDTFGGYKRGDRFEEPMPVVLVSAKTP